MARVVAVVGMPGSGKGVLARVAMDVGIPVLSMGDIVREALVEKELSETPENVAITAQMIREDFGEAIVAERMLHRIHKIQNAELILIEGVRQSVEMDIFREAFRNSFSVIGIEATEENRAERISSRGRGEDGSEIDFITRDIRESNWGLPKLVASADEKLRNDTDIATFEILCEKWLREA